MRMNNKFISLTKIQLKDFISKYKSNLNITGGSMRELLLLVALVALTIPAFQLSVTLYNSFAQINQAHLSITYLYLAVVVMIFINAIPFVVSTFFYAKDLRFLASLPIEEEIIIFAKLTSVYIYLMGFTLILLGPGIFVYVGMSGVTVLGIILGLLGLLLAPVLPLVISCLLIFPFMRLVSNSKYRNLFSIIGGLFLLVFILGIQTFIVRQQSNPELIMEFMAREDGLLQFMGLRFPPSVWYTRMIAGSLKDTIIFVLLNLLLVYILKLLGRVFYKKSLLEFNQDQSNVVGKIYYRQSSKKIQLIRRHILIILRQPTFLLQTLLTSILPVILFAITMFTGELNTEFFTNPAIQPYIPFIFAGVLITPAVTTNLSATVITREGKFFWETKALPVSVEENIQTRIASTVIINLLASLLLAIVTYLILPLTVTQIILGVLVGITGTYFIATADIIINIMRPYLNWISPTAAIKNNLNVILALIWRVGLFILVYLAYKLLGGLTPETSLGMLAIIFGVLYLIARYVVYNRFTRAFNEIQT